MISKRYKNIEELKKFVINKIDKSQKIDKKYNFFNKIKKTAFLLSLFSLSSYILYFIYSFIILGEINPALLFTSFINILFSFMMSLLVEYFDKKIRKINIEYNHADFEELSCILSPAEMERFMTEIDSGNFLSNWKEFVTPEESLLIVEVSPEDKIDIRKTNRLKYIDSLYKRT